MQGDPWTTSYTVSIKEGQYYLCSIAGWIVTLAVVGNPSDLRVKKYDGTQINLESITAGGIPVGLTINGRTVGFSLASNKKSTTISCPAGCEVFVFGVV